MSTNNKNCGISGELLIDFLLEELSLEETADLDNHIRECHSCSVELEFMVNSFNTIREVEMPHVSSNTYFALKNRIFGKKETAAIRKSNPKEPYKQLMSMALSVVAVLFFYNYMIIDPVSTISMPYYELNDQEFWAGDTIVTAGAMSTSAPMRDSLAFLSNFLLFHRSIKIASLDIQSKFYFFSADMLSPYALMNRIISSTSVEAGSASRNKGKLISDASKSISPTPQFYRQKPVLIA